MFAKSSLLVMTIFAAISFAAAWGSPPTPTVTVTVAPQPTTTSPASQCDTGPVQCCDSTTTAGAPSAADVLSLIGVVVQNLDVVVGLSCSPISVVGLGSGATCAADPVCCEDNNFNGLIAIGCSPVDLGL